MSAAPSAGLPEVVALLLVLLLNAYVLTGGADFGGGVWDLLARGPRREAQRSLIAHAIAPIWEANHVWLIVVIVVLFTAFPAAFASLGTVLHIPLTIMLLGIVLRGSAFVFRSYGARSDRDARRWGLAFAIASAGTPVVLGACIGAIASGEAGTAMSRLVAMRAGGAPPSFAEAYVRPWLGPFPLAVGILALASFAFLAAVYSTLRTDDAELQDDFRRRSLGAAAGVFVAAFGALAVAGRAAPRMQSGLLADEWAVPLHIATGVAACIAIWALWARRFALARIAAAAQVSCILWGWVAAQYPYLLPPALTIRNAAAPARTLELLVLGLAGGTVVLVPSLWYLFRTFGGTSLNQRASRSASRSGDP